MAELTERQQAAYTALHRAGARAGGRWVSAEELGGRFEAIVGDRRGLGATLGGLVTRGVAERRAEWGDPKYFYRLLK